MIFHGSRGRYAKGFGHRPVRPSRPYRTGAASRRHSRRRDLGLRFLGSEQAQPLILGLLAFFAMAGVFFLFAMAIGVIQFAGKSARNDITKLDGRHVERRARRRSRTTGASSMPTRPISPFAGLQRRRGAHRSSGCSPGAPEVSEAIYRLAQAAREHRTGSEEIRLSPVLERRAGIRLVSGARACRCRDRTGVRRRSGPSPTSPMSASGRRTSSRNSSTPSTISTMPPRAFCPSIPTAPSSISTRRSPPGSTTTSRRSARAG